MDGPRNDAFPGDIAPDLSDDAVVLPWLARMRDEHPVWRDGRGDWHVFRHADVRAALRDAAAFSSATNAGGPMPGMLTHTDPPEHHSLRRTVGAAFTPRTVDALEPRIREVARALLERTGERFELVEALAFPLPVSVICELLGLPAADHTRFRRWADDLFDIQLDDPGDPAFAARLAEVFAPVDAYFRDQVRQRRARPGADLVSRLVTAEVDGRTLDETEASNFALSLHLAGHITTTTLLAGVVLTLDEQPELWQRLHADPSLVPAVIEEVLRLRPPFAQLPRVTRTDVVVAGTEIPAGSRVTLWVLSANRDPSAHAEPDRALLDRGVRGPAQLSFGHGIHFCLGAPLARLEVRVAIEEIVRRHRRLEVDRDPGRPHGGLLPFGQIAYGTRRLPVAARPRSA